MKKRTLTEDQVAGAAVAAKLKHEYVTFWGAKDSDGDCFISPRKPKAEQTRTCPSCKHKHAGSFEWTGDGDLLISKADGARLGIVDGVLTQLMLVPVETE